MPVMHFVEWKRLACIKQTVSIQLGNYKINSNEEKTEAGTGYFKKQIPGRPGETGNGKHPSNIVYQQSSITANRQPSTINHQPFLGRSLLAIL